MRPEKKRDYRQQRLAFANKALWERLPEPHRVRSRELIVELLRAVVLVRREPGREDERKA
jgi:hypothetical protein